MKTISLGGLTVHVAGGDDREGGGEGPALVLLHGYGAPGTDLVPLWRQLEVPAGTRFVFPEAPQEVDLGVVGMNGRAWWQLDVLELQQRLSEGPEAALEVAARDPAGLEQARNSLLGLLDELAQHYGVDPAKTVLGGFSQGAMVACDAALRSERSLAGLVLLSAAPIALNDWRQLARKRAGLRVLQSHGREDPLLPFKGAELLRDVLNEAGLQVQFYPFTGGHTIADGVVSELGDFLRRTVGDAS